MTTLSRWPRRPRRLPLPPWPLDACTPVDAVAWLVAADRAYELGYDREATWARKVAKALEGGPRLVLVSEEWWSLGIGDAPTLHRRIMFPGAPIISAAREYGWWTPTAARLRFREIAPFARQGTELACVVRAMSRPTDWPDLLPPREQGGRPDVALAWFRRIARGVKVEG